MTGPDVRILVSNDDGFSAPGLRALVDAAKALTPDVWVVAPQRKWTAASHQLSFDRVLTLDRIAEREYACSGAPADCVVAAMTLLLRDQRPDLVLAGINDKINVAEDIAYSGTLAIAREATFWDVPAVSISRDANPGTGSAADVVTIGNLLRLLWKGKRQWSGPGCWLALNLPARLPAPLVQARVGHDKIAGDCETIDSNPASISFRIARGRPGASTNGDERAVVAAGGIALVRHRWFASAELPQETLDSWNRGAPVTGH